MAAQRVFADRSDGKKYAMTIEDDGTTDGKLGWAETSDTAEAEPIVEDDAAPGTYWQFYFDNGSPTVESTATVQDDLVDLEDSGFHAKLIVSSGMWGWEAFTPAPGGDDIFHFMRRGTHEGLMVGVR